VVDRERKSLEEKSILEGEESERRRLEERLSRLVRREESMVKRWGCVGGGGEEGGPIAVAEGFPLDDGEVLDMCPACSED
jgi:hypothetical protein